MASYDKRVFRNTLIRMAVQTLLYNCENWSLPREHERRLETAEMKYCALYNTSEDIRELDLYI